MNEMNMAGIFIMAFLMGGIMLFFGAIIKYFNAGDIINFFNKKKHDKEKASRIIGGDMMITGIIIISTSFISIFIDKVYYNYLSLFHGAVLILGVIVSYYHLSKRCKIEEQ